MKGWRAWLLGVAAWLLFLVATLPAERVLALVPELPGVAIGRVQGTLWRGEARRLRVQGMEVSALGWRFRWLPLLSGRVEFALRGRLYDKPLRARAGVSFDGTPLLHDLSGSLPAAELLYRLGVDQVKVAGDLVFSLDEVVFPAEGVPLFSGELRWSPARIEAPLDLLLGTVTLTTEHDETVTRGRLVASGGALGVEADVALEAAGAYRLDARIRRNGQVPQAVNRFLSSFAEYRDGLYYLEWSDSL